MRTFTIDFETYYKTDKDNPENSYSLRDMSMDAYVNDPRFDALLVSVVEKESGLRWVGDPKFFDWTQIDGALCVAHNAQFDPLIVTRLQRDGVIPAYVRPADWVDTADMSAFLRVQRNLKNAVKHLLGKTISKKILVSMDGMTRQMLYADPEKLKAVSEYCLCDSDSEDELWHTCNGRWPEEERLISKFNRNAGCRGFLVNTDQLAKDLESLTIQRHKAAMALPWFDGQFKGLLSIPHVKAQAQKDGMPTIPISFAKNDLAAQRWIAQYQDQFPWVKALGDFRSMNAFVKKLELLKAGLRADGVSPYQLKYFGAGTGRFTAGAGEEDDNQNTEDRVFNPLNMYKEPMYGCDLKGLIVPRPGKAFMVYDYKQIEAVLLLWTVGAEDALAHIRKGMSVYEAHARATMGWTGGSLKKEDPRQYQFAKARVLGGGYSIGAAKFQKQFLPEETVEACKDIVMAYRAANQPIVNLWRWHDRGLRYSVNHNDATHEFNLVNGRTMTYHNPREVADAKSAFGKRILAEQFLGGKSKGVYGGLLTNNQIQATARDVLCAGWRALAAVGLETNVLLTVYDDFLIEIDADQAKNAQDIAHIIDHAADAWLPGCPVSGDWHIAEHY